MYIAMLGSCEKSRKGLLLLLLRLIDFELGSANSERDFRNSSSSLEGQRSIRDSALPIIWHISSIFSQDFDILEIEKYIPKNLFSEVSVKGQYFKDSKGPDYL